MGLSSSIPNSLIQPGICTSSTRPTNPYEGQVIYETDTNRTLYYDNAAWLVIADSSVLRLDTTNSRVGVNTTSPGTALDVIGTTTVRTASAQDGVALAGRAGGTGGLSATLTPTSLTANRTLTLPNRTGTVALTANVGLTSIIPTSVAGTGVSQTGTDSMRVVFSSASSISVNGVFSSTYRHYKVVWSVNGSSQAAYLRWKNRSAGTDTTDSSYTTVGALWSVSAGTGSGTNIGTGNQGTSSMICGYYQTAVSAGGGIIEVQQPFIADYTTLSFMGGGNNNNSSLGSVQGTAIHYVASSYDGFTIIPSGGIVTGSLCVYGYNE